jgi:hypothetical protein
LSDADTSDLVAAIPIVHVYGQLGNLPWQKAADGRVRGYRNDTTAGEVQIARDQIQLVHEGRQDSAHLATARAVLEAAERIYFLGFSYHDVNMARLQINKTTRGTAQGLLTAEKQRITNQWKVNLEDVDALTFLRECVQLASAR